MAGDDRKKKKEGRGRKGREGEGAKENSERNDEQYTAKVISGKMDDCTTTSNEEKEGEKR